MKRPTGWPANPQAMAIVSQRLRYEGHPELGKHVDVDTWLTPRYILDQLGTFDLDPCAAEENRDWTGASRTYNESGRWAEERLGWSGFHEPSVLEYRSVAGEAFGASSRDQFSSGNGRSEGMALPCVVRRCSHISASWAYALLQSRRQHHTGTAASLNCTHRLVG